uniref:ShKT domain-containing protein n=1 Tax=Steinernema glaseri TaxID=37863 RepID=A0A1I7Y8P6_9BILA
MVSAYLPLAALLLCVSLVESFNLCNLDSAVCVPFIDLQPNCTCILEPTGQPINRSTDTSVFVQQKSLPADLFSFLTVPRAIRESLGERIPASEQYSSHLMRDLPTADISEEFFFIAVNQSSVESFFQMIHDQNVLADSYLSANLPHWCSSGDCNFIEFDNRGFDSSNNSYRFISTVIQVTSDQGMSFVAVSEVESRLFVDANIRKMCATECEIAESSTKEYCRNKCAEKIRYENMSRIGQMKKDLMGHTQAATIDNLRVKYKKFLKDYPARV